MLRDRYRCQRLRLADRCRSRWWQPGRSCALQVLLSIAAPSDPLGHSPTRSSSWSSATVTAQSAPHAPQRSQIRTPVPPLLGLNASLSGLVGWCPYRVSVSTCSLALSSTCGVNSSTCAMRIGPSRQAGHATRRGVVGTRALALNRPVRSRASVAEAHGRSLAGGSSRCP